MGNLAKLHVAALAGTAHSVAPPATASHPAGHGFVLQRIGALDGHAPLYYAPRPAGPQWTGDEEQALCFARQFDAECFAATLPDPRAVVPIEICWD